MVELEKVFTVPWKNRALIEEAVDQKIPDLLASDRAFQNACLYSDPQNMRVEAELAIKRAISSLLADYLDLFTKFTKDSTFSAALTSTVLDAISRRESFVRSHSTDADTSTDGE
jgi:hypothetical protein